MVRLVKSEWNINLEKQNLIDLEEAIIKSLDYELHFTGPILFLERYLRIYNLDLTRTDREAHTLNLLAHTFCRMILRT